MCGVRAVFPNQTSVFLSVKKIIKNTKCAAAESEIPSLFHGILSTGEYTSYLGEL